MTASIQNNQLLFNEAVAATWTDDYTESCGIGLSLTSAESAEVKTIASGDILSEAGTLRLTVTDEFGNSATAEIKLMAVAVFGLENLQNKQLQVDQEVNLLEGITFAEGLTLQKVEIVQEGVRTVIDNPRAYTPDYPGSIRIVLTLSKPDGSTLEAVTNNLNINPLDYHPVTLETADFISNRFSWYYNLNADTKKFIYPHLILSEYVFNRCKQNNRIHIML